MSPFETYQAYLGLKNHFSNPKYDYFKYKKTRATLASFNRRADKYFFEKSSRKYNDKEIVNFLVSNFVATDNPQSIWIGEIINSGERTLPRMDAPAAESDLLIQGAIDRIVLSDKIRECFRLLERSSNSSQNISKK
jgi:hypothetical protein